MINNSDPAVIENRKQRALRALHRIKVLHQLGYYYSILGAGIIVTFIIQVYADGEVMFDTGCMICRGSSEEEIEALYNNVGNEGFHCDNAVCTERFHDIMHQTYGCCNKPYDPDHHPIGDPFPDQQ